MPDDRRPYSADEKETFGWVDDELQQEEQVEDEILEAEDYKGATRHGTTPAEERRGVPLDEELRDEVPEDLEAPVPDEWDEAPDPRAGTLVDSWGVFAEEREAPPEDPEQEALHTTEDEEPAPRPEDWR